MDRLGIDFKYALRKLFKSPGFAVVTVLTLALGIGANTAIFSVVQSILMRPLAYPEPDGLVMVWESNLSKGLEQNVASPANYLDWKEGNSVFQDMAAMFFQGVTLSGWKGAERVQAGVVSPSFFRILLAEAELGRVFGPADGEPGAEDVVVLSHGLWQRRYGGDPEIVGRTITLNTSSYTVVGVMPADFEGLSFNSPVEAFRSALATSQDLWVPLTLGEGARERRGRWAMVLARLRTGVTPDQAQAEMTTLARQLEEEYEFNSGWGAKVVPLREQIVGDVGPALLVLLGAVGMVLLLACSNVANLLLARATGRQRELAVRVAVGADRRRLIRQLLTESVILAGLGGAVGLLFAIWGVESLVALSPAGIPRLAEIGISQPVLLFTLAVSLLCAVLFGLMPALHASRPDVQGSLKEGGRGSSQSAGERMRRALVVAEMALSVVLLIGAGLAIRSFWELRQVDPGFEPENVLGLQITLPSARYEEDQQVTFFARLIESVESLPGVQAAAATVARPLGGGLAPATSFWPTDRPAPEPGDRQSADIRMVTPGYFRAMGIPMHAGRDFASLDGPEAPPVVIVNETLARTYWPDEEAIGKHLVVRMGDEAPREIVGVVGDVRHTSLDVTPRAKVYYPHAQLPVFNFMDLVVRSAGDPATLVRAVRQEVQAMDANLPVHTVNSMNELIADSVAEERFYMFLLSLFAVVALTLASVGIYGVIAFAVSRRTHEVGIRLALGAERAEVLRLVVLQGVGLAAMGAVVGVIAAYGFTRFMASLLFEVSTSDPLTFVSVPFLLGATAVAACLIPAWRAARVDPLEALRYE